MMPNKYFVCSKCGKKPPEVTSFHYGEQILCSLCAPPTKEVSKEMQASGLAERAWGEILHLQRAGRIQGELTYKEFRERMEPLFLEALGGAQ